jgi:HEAT repeat protein
MPPLLERMRKGNRDDRELAASLLAALGGRAVAALVDAILGDRVLQVRQSLAGTLKIIGPGGAQLLGEQVQPEADRDRCIAALEVIERAGTAALDDVFVRGMRHPEEEVRNAATAMVKRLTRPQAAPVLRRALKDLPEDVRPAIVRLASEMKVGELSTEICRLLEEEPSVPVAAACCRYFAQVPLRAAVPLLSKVAETRSRMFGILKGYPDDVRAAAVWALGQVETDEAKAALSRVSREGNTTIRMAASQAMKAKPQASGDRGEAPTRTLDPGQISPAEPERETRRVKPEEIPPPKAPPEGEK